MFKNLTITAFLGAIAIILGAFGSHQLKETLTFEQLQSFETAVRYQMFHVVVLLFINSFHDFSVKQKNTISCLFFVGIAFFSGSIYLIQLTAVTAKSIWFVTPLGGLFLIAGWISLLVVFVKKHLKNRK